MHFCAFIIVGYNVLSTCTKLEQRALRCIELQKAIVYSATVITRRLLQIGWSAESVTVQATPPSARPTYLISLSSWLRRRTGRATGEHRPQLSTGARRIMWSRITSQNSVSTFKCKACIRETRFMVVSSGKHGC